MVVDSSEFLARIRLVNVVCSAQQASCGIPWFQRPSLSPRFLGPLEPGYLWK